MNPTERPISEATKLEVRRACFFGCVICGKLPYHYDHFGTEFKDADDHDPSKIALLCPNHHQEKTSRRLSNATVSEARSEPFNKGRELRYLPELGRGGYTARMPGVTMKMTSEETQSTCVLVNGGVLFGVRRGQEGRWLFDADLRDMSGSGRLQIISNEIFISSGAWDVKLEGTELVVRSGQGQRTAVLSIEPDSRTVALTRLRMSLGGGFVMDGNDQRFKLLDARGNVRADVTSFTAKDCTIAASFDYQVQYPRWPYV